MKNWLLKNSLLFLKRWLILLFSYINYYSSTDWLTDSYTEQLKKLPEMNSSGLFLQRARALYTLRAAIANASVV